MSISTSVLDIFHLTWDMYEEAIVKIPEEDWKRGEDRYLIPSRLIYHVLDSSDFYSSPKPEEFVRGYRFNINWKEAAPEQLPEKVEIRAYFEEVRSKVEDWLEGMKDIDFISENEKFPWTGSTKLSGVLYLLSHCRQHFGELNAELRRRGLPRIKWKTY